jgi:hypothetical protein
MSPEVWFAILFLVVLKIPLGYICWVIWWAVKAEPEVGTEGGTEGLEGINWKPWRRPPGSRPPRRGPHGGRSRKATPAARSRERASS